MSPGIEIVLALVFAASSCALLGSFLVLRKMAMLTDAISHAILPGIVVAYFFVHDISSPALFIGAAITGVITVWLIELVYQSGNLKQDAAIGVVFPALFAIGVVLVTRYAGDAHLDIDAVLMGEPAFIPLSRFVIAGKDLAADSTVRLGLVLLANFFLIVLLYKEFKFATFDAATATMVGIAPVFMHYVLMTAVSCTAVMAFDSVGSILVVALFSGPPMAAYLMTNRLPVMLILSVAIGALSSLLGYAVAAALDVSIAGAVATVCGVLFLASFVFNGRNGILVQVRRSRQKNVDAAIKTLLVHLLHHQKQPDLLEDQMQTLHHHLSWTKDTTAFAVSGAENLGYVRLQDETVLLTDEGRQAAARYVTT